MQASVEDAVSRADLIVVAHIDRSLVDEAGWVAQGKNVLLLG